MLPYGQMFFSLAHTCSLRLASLKLMRKLRFVKKVIIFFMNDSEHLLITLFIFIFIFYFFLVISPLQK